MQIDVKMFKVWAIVLDVDFYSTTILDVKQEISKQKGKSITDWRLLYKSKSLADNETLSKCNINQRSTLVCLGEQKGGGCTAVVVDPVTGKEEEIILCFPPGTTASSLIEFVAK